MISTDLNTLFEKELNMKKYMIEVVPKFEKNPTAEEFENICNSIVDAVDNYCNNQERSFHVTYSLQVGDGVTSFKKLKFI